MRILTYNLCRGGIGRADRIAAVLRRSGADLVVCQEATNPRILSEVAEATGMAQCASRQGRSLGFISRTPVSHYEWHRPRFSQHAFLEIVPADYDCVIIGLHLSAVHSAWTEQRRLFETRSLIGAITREERRRHLLVGDFNTLAPGERLDIRQLPHRLRAMVWLSGGRIRWRVVQTILEAGYLDVYRTHHPTEAGLTFPTWNPHVRLDYAFVPAGDEAMVAGCEVVTDGAEDASDHFPLCVDLAPIELAADPPTEVRSA